MWDKYLLQPVRTSDTRVLFDVLRTGKFSFTSDKTELMYYMRKLRYCDLVLLRETYFPAGLGFALPRGAIHRKYFDDV